MTQLVMCRLDPFHGILTSQLIKKLVFKRRRIKKRVHYPRVLIRGSLALRYFSTIKKVINFPLKCYTSYQHIWIISATLYESYVSFMPIHCHFKTNGSCDIYILQLWVCTGRQLKLYRVEQIDTHVLLGVVRDNSHPTWHHIMPRKTHIPIYSTLYKFKCKRRFIAEKSYIIHIWSYIYKTLNLF